VGAARFPINERRLAPKLQEFEEAAGADAWRAAWEEGRALPYDGILDELPEPSPGVAPTTGPSGDQATVLTAPAEVGSAAASIGSRYDLSVRALGPLEVEVEGAPFDPDRWSWAKPREGLVYLLLHPEGVTRDQLGAALWPDAPPSRVKNSFHVAIHHLRKSLGHPEWILLEGDRYLLAPRARTWCDVRAFEDAMRCCDRDVDALRRALSLWRGALLEGEAVGAWADDHRDRLGRLADEGWLTLGGLLVSAGDDRGAAEAFHRVVVRDPLREDALRALMGAWARTGQRGRALRHYEELRAMLREELDAAPEEATVALAAELRGGEGS
jgi:DNA-binding SARP family transcriptional activator